MEAAWAELVREACVVCDDLPQVPTLASGLSTTGWMGVSLRARQSHRRRDSHWSTAGWTVKLEPATPEEKGRRCPPASGRPAACNLAGGGDGERLDSATRPCAAQMC